MRNIQVGLIQMKVVNDKESNIDKAQDMIEKVVKEGAELVVLPEMFNCPYQTDKFPEYAEKEGGYTWQRLSGIARENEILLVGGSVPEKTGDSIYNTSYIFNRHGEQIGKHRKIHLFDIDVEGGQSFKESDTLSGGEKISVIKTPLGGIGVIICYDLRFPELSRILVQKGVDIIIVPGAFNMTTGPAHWELLFRTRALDNQVYTIGAAPARNQNSSYISYGNSLIVDPWGKIVKRLGAGEGIIVEELDLSMIRKIRSELPLLKHLRQDIYQLQERAENKDNGC